MQNLFFTNYFSKLYDLFSNVDNNTLHAAAKKIHLANKKGGKVIIVIGVLGQRKVLQCKDTLRF